MALAFFSLACPAPGPVRSGPAASPASTVAPTPPTGAPAQPPLPLSASAGPETFSDLYAVRAVAAGPTTVWLGTDGGGVLRFGAQGGRPSRRYDVSDGLPSAQVTALALLDGENDLAIGTAAGLVRLQGETITPLAAGLPAGGAVRALAVGRDKVLWVGSDSGLWRLPLDDLRAGRPALSGWSITALSHDAAGDLWVGTADRGVLHLAGEFAEQFGPAHGLGSNGVRALVTTGGGGVIAVAPLAEGGHAFSLYDGVQWHPLALEQPNAHWQILGLALVRSELLVLTNFGPRRLRQISRVGLPPAALVQLEQQVASSWPRVVSQTVPPPPPATVAPVTPPAATVAPAAPPADPELAAPLPAPSPQPDKIRGLAWQRMFEAARDGRASFARGQARREALRAELDELATRQRSASERVDELERQLVAGSGGAAATSPEQQRLAETGLVSARRAQRQAAVAEELATSRLRKLDEEVTRLRSEARRRRLAYLTATGRSETTPEDSGTGSDATTTHPTPALALQVRPAPYPERTATDEPTLMLEPTEVESGLLPGAVTCWQGSEVDGGLWIGSAHRGALRWEPKRSARFAAGDLLPRGLAQGPLIDGAGTVWVIGSEGRLARFDGARWLEDELPAPPPAAGAPGKPLRLVPQALTLGPDGSLQAAASRGGSLLLFRRFGDAWQGAGARTLFEGPGVLQVTAWAIDAEGRSWLGLQRSDDSGELRPAGLLMLHPGAARLVHHPGQPGWTPAGAETGASLPSDRVTVVRAAGKTVWIGTDSGLGRLDAEGLRSFDENDGMEAEWVRDLVLLPAGGLLVATSEGVGRLGPDDRWSFSHAGARGGLPSGQVQALALGRDGVPWAATPDGPARLGEGGWQPVAVPSELPLDIRRLLFDDQGRVWLLLGDRLALTRFEPPPPTVPRQER